MVSITVRAMISGAFLTVFLFPAMEASEESPDELKKELRGIVQSNSAVLMSRFIQRLSKLDDPKTVPFLVEGAVSIPSLKNYQEARKALSQFSNEETIDALIKICSESECLQNQDRLPVVLGFRADLGQGIDGFFV